MPDPDEPLVHWSEVFRPPERSTFPGTGLDVTKIAFPSDQLTIKDLRRYMPTAFDLSAGENNLYDVEGRFNRVSLETCLGAIIDKERELAHLAYCNARGITPPKELGNRDEGAEVLAVDYIELGLASGSHHAEQLIRAFEQAAAEQARQQAPAPPSR